MGRSWQTAGWRNKICSASRNSSLISKKLNPITTIVTSGGQRKKIVFIWRVQSFLKGSAWGQSCWGLSTREIEASVKKFQTLAGLLLIGVSLVGLVASFLAARSLSSRIRGIASGLKPITDPEMEILAGREPENSTSLSKAFCTQKNLFKSSLAELESQSIQLETDLSLSKEENSTLSSRLSVMSKQIEELQGKTPNRFRNIPRI